MRTPLRRSALWCIAFAMAVGASLFWSDMRSPDPEEEPSRTATPQRDGEPAWKKLRAARGISTRAAEKADEGEPRARAYGVGRAQPSVAVAPGRTWWSRALGRDADDPALVTNTDDRILVALAADLLQRSDLRALEDLIALNQLDEGSSPFDRNDGDGLLSAWELGFQVWQDGRLVAFSLGPDPHSSFRYEIDALPASFEDLDQLRYLGLQQNQLRELPTGLGRLGRLEQLIASDNRLSALPESIEGLRSLERLVLSHNLLEELPESIGRLGALSALYLADNPLHSLPEDLSSLPGLRVLDLSRSGAQALAARGADSLLPTALQLASLEEMYLAGHPSLCAVTGPAGRQFTTADGSTVQVYGAKPADCAP